VDYDGDGLTSAVEYRLWKYTYEVNHTATRTLSPLSYSAGAQYSLSVLTGGNGVRRPTMAVSAYTPPQSFRSWANGTGYGTVSVPYFVTPRDLYDMDGLNGVTSVPTGNQVRAELTYWDLDFDNYVSDDERDEDADGLTNYDEAIGPMSADWWSACYSEEAPYPIKYAGTEPFDGDSDGDGILDGADDQDFDDVPNIMELSRNMAGNFPFATGANGCNTGSAVFNPAIWSNRQALVNPFNPCLPDRNSRTCPRHPTIGEVYPPFDPEWNPFVLN
jgi:hypothetical protein